VRMADEHSCKALAVHCIDFRIQKFVNEYLDERFPKGYDRVAAPGGVRYIAQGGEEGKFELEECAVSYTLHHPKVFVLIQHEDCGAYGGSKAFGSEEEERHFQKAELEKAAAVLQEAFPGRSIETYFVYLSGEMVE
jgi:hypothetical protein